MHTVDLELKGRVALFRMKSDQFADLPESEHFRLELLNGVVVMAARPSADHQFCLLKLSGALDTWVTDNNLGLILPEFQLHLDEDWSPVPDLLFLASKHRSRLKRKWVVGPADLVVEILSPNDEQADRKTKLSAYARFGIPWYWIIDLDERILDEYRRGRSAYGKPVRVSFDEPFRPRLFPGLEIDLTPLELGKIS